MALPTESDDGLVKLAKDGNNNALIELFRRHDDKLRAFVYGLIPTSSDLDDAMQETYLKAYKSLSTFKGESSFATWLHRVAYNSVIDERRRSRLKLVSDDDAIVDEPQPGSSTEEVVGAQVEVREVLSKLPENQRVAVLMIDGHGFSYRDVAEVLDINESTVGVHLNRARKAIRAMAQKVIDLEKES